MTKTKTNVQQIRNKSATGSRKTRTKKATKVENVNESGTHSVRIRYAFAPLLQQFRAHTKKNEARLWMPIETNLVSRYDFATLSPQSRYVFVAILLYCAGNGINEIPLDTKFMSSVLSVDSRTIEKSFCELLFVNLLQERKEREEKNRKEQTDRQEEIALDARVSVVDFNSFSESNGNGNGNKTEIQNESESGLLKIVPSDAPNLAKKIQSKFSIEECMRYVELCIADGDLIQNGKALARNLYRTGEADPFIFQKLFPKEAEQFAAQSFGEVIQFTDEPCRVCFGAKMADVDGNGYRSCVRCKDERGKSTGWEAKGESSNG